MSSNQNGNPLPAPPGQAQGPRYQQPAPAVRPRSKSNFSFRSNKSHKSEGSVGKIDYSKIHLVETHDEKQSKRLTSKADPRLAMSEAEPSAIANSTGSSLAPLRAIQHRDSVGNTIAEPDRSNPTRSRWERPLDTIRSFEAAIDGNYSRKSMQRTESSSSIHGGGYSQSRRTSYYGSNVGSPAPPRNPMDGYYGGRSQSQRPDSYFDESHGNGQASGGQYSNRARYPRTASAPVFNHGVYPPNGGNHLSHETVNSASGSGGSYAEPTGYSTDPSSENSSVDRIHADGYVNGGPESGAQVPRSYQQSMPMIHEGYQQRHAAPEPAQAPARAPIKLGGDGSSGRPGVYEPPKAEKEKRKSWLGRRFSSKG